MPAVYNGAEVPPPPSTGLPLDMGSQ